MYVVSKKGDEPVLNIFRPVSFFPLMWAVNNTQNKYYYEATTPVIVWKAPKDQLIQFLKQNPDVLYDLIARVYKGIDGLLIRMMYLMTGNAHTRLITEILIYSKRFGKPCLKNDLQDSSHDYKKAMKLHMTEKDIAVSAGMSRETVSREMKNLKKKGLLTFEKGTLVIFNIQDLEDELSNS